MLGLSDDDLLDGWGRPFAVVEQRDYDEHQRGLASAGTDGRVGTRDDLAYFFDTQPPEETSQEE